MTGYQKEQCSNYSEFIRTNKDVEIELYVGFYDEDDKFIFHEQGVMTQELSCITELEVRYINNSFIETNYLLADLKVCEPYKNYTMKVARLMVADGTYEGSMENLYLTNSSAKTLGSTEFHCIPG